MFSSNQIFNISGDFSQLENTIRFAVNFATNENQQIVYQKTSDGKYCIGLAHDKKDDGWKEYDFEFDAKIVSLIIQQFLKNQGFNAFYLKSIPETFSDEYDGIKNPFFGLFLIEGYKNFYSK